MTTLHQLANRLAGSFLPAAVRNHNFFINEIPSDLSIKHNMEWLASVINGMLAEIVTNTNDACIRLSARKYGYIVVLEIQQEGAAEISARNSAIQQLQGIAEKIGGCLHISSRKPKTSLLSFSFPDLPLLN